MTNHATFAIQDLLQQPVWGTAITIGTRLSIEFGDEISMPGHRHSHGTWHLLLMDCYWRIEDDRSILIGSDDDDLAVRIADLHLGKVNNVQFLPPANDLEIIFDNNFRLITFSTHSRITPESKQWYLFCPGDIVLVSEGAGNLVSKNRHES
jgi:hypothetical protein